ncbi:uncharacterized protein PV09_00165 [Verruconis gallopava]|uniref:Uncharacterized protein n=1 Tax=Verruconis gallopava TaxID=253628 RepID=A0A0D2BCU3_9PEZI|nr:uncharacterized protein PV09_00165 [Verruconis gallopava]KIW09239.1 hypothetical protein PV09_00165 [Verruconis gallopava]
MAEEIYGQVPEARVTPRRGKAKAVMEVIDEGGASAQQQDGATIESTTNRNEKGETQAKERRKPRKLERRSVVLEEPVVTLDTRVERLERQFQALSSRVDAVEDRQMRRPTTMTYRRSSSTSTRATSAPRARRRTAAPQPGAAAAASSMGPRPSLADQLRESQRLRRIAQRQRRGETIEEVPRADLTSSLERTRQVALAGQYRIPLPSSLTAEDVLNLKNGLNAAGSIARSLASALTSSRDGGSGTATPRVSTATVSTAGPSRSHRETTRSAAGPADGKGDSRNTNLPGGSASSAAAQGNASSSPGNRQPEGRDVVGAENASKSWKSFIASAVTDLVTSAAKDAAVEIQQGTSHKAPMDADRATDGGSMKKADSPFVGTATDELRASEGAKSYNTNARGGRKGSRTSSRASSYRVS